MMSLCFFGDNRYQLTDPFLSRFGILGSEFTVDQVTGLHAICGDRKSQQIVVIQQNLCFSVQQ
uniref:Uncharacterized protein n=1 Tax=Romanomermis culicivorax TaxID=13658 RepID=A0A915KLB4_ROMCU